MKYTIKDGVRKANARQVWGVVLALLLIGSYIFINQLENIIGGLSK